LLGEEYGEGLLPVDTGFEGSIMLDRDAYELFAVGELPREMWGISGSPNLRRVRRP